MISVTSGTIADGLKTQFDITLDKKKIHLDHPIKTLGEHEVELRLHPEVVTSMKVRIESDRPLEKPEPVGGAEAGRDHRDHGRVTEKRGRRFDGKAEEAKPEAKGKIVEPKGKPEAKAKRVEKK